MKGAYLKEGAYMNPPLYIYIYIYTHTQQDTHIWTDIPLYLHTNHTYPGLIIYVTRVTFVKCIVPFVRKPGYDMA